MPSFSLCLSADRPRSPWSSCSSGGSTVGRSDLDAAVISASSSSEERPRIRCRGQNLRRLSFSQDEQLTTHHSVTLSSCVKLAGAAERRACGSAGNLPTDERLRSCTAVTCSAGPATLSLADQSHNKEQQIDRRQQRATHCSCTRESKPCQARNQLSFSAVRNFLIRSLRHGQSPKYARALSLYLPHNTLD